MQTIKELRVTPKARIFVTDEPSIWQEGLAPENFNAIIEFVAECLLTESDKFIIFLKVADNFGCKWHVMAFAWALLCGTTLAENLDEVCDIIDEADEGELHYTVIDKDAGMYQ